MRNLLIVFFLTGLWHGAAWRFVVWGLYHGGFLMLERFGLGRVLERAPKLVRHALCDCGGEVGWVFFRADSLPQALGYLARMAHSAGPVALDPGLAILMNAQTFSALAVGSILAMPVLPALMERLRAPRAEPPRPDLPARLQTGASTPCRSRCSPWAS